MRYIKVALISILVLFLGMVLWMAYFFYFRTDGKGHVVREADSPVAEANGQRLLAHADALMASGSYAPAGLLLDSLRDADANPNMFIATDALMQRYDTLRTRQRRDASAE